ncbi:DUF5658 family protein [Robertmurraya andreesenii]|uniref:DUF5658 domain-containing protein n=1 Tax=Anoxybacillus andreesenii TaxID=1325932 RepID=A0ABT9V2D1_9BACL|nr:DUF5658 family protein [Robertmurraya andreesenii]MDQ0155108.1 hypothetical protein [Robertmurraya andreesenii]
MSKIFIFLSVLNVFDGFVTFIGVRGDMIEEYNPFMAYLIDVAPWSFLIVKVLLSLFLLIISRILMEQSISFILRFLALISVTLYITVTATHFVWLYFLIF